MPRAHEAYNRLVCCRAVKVCEAMERMAGWPFIKRYIYKKIRIWFVRLLEQAGFFVFSNET